MANVVKTWNGLSDASVKTLLGTARASIKTRNGADAVTSAIASHTPLGSIVASCVFDLDATSTDSYDGTSQTFANIEPTPADGAAQTDYDFWLGNSVTATTNDPTFNGTAGYQDAYFSFDGGDYFLGKTLTTFISGLNLSASGHDFTYVFVGYVPNCVSQTGIFQTGGSGSTSNGVRLDILTNEVLRPRMRGDTAAVTQNTVTLPQTTPFVVSIAYQDSDTKLYGAVNNRTQSSWTYTKNACTTSAVVGPYLCFGNGSNAIEVNARLYAVSMFNAKLSDSDLGLIYDEYNSRHGRTYA
jgi:hypothetical protein